MAFDDHPQVDEAAKRSEESVLFTKLVLSRKNGFISREETPDYGADLSVELISDRENATGYIFAVQIKSTENAKKVNVNNERYVSYSIATSRLGYLCRRIPGLGLIILYEHSNERCYFDYVENIVARISLVKGNENWKQQTEVTMHIPELNILSKREAVLIHENIKNKFLNHLALIDEHGADFGIENHFSMDSSSEDNLPDIQNPLKLASWLDSNGLQLVHNQEFGLLSTLITNLRYEDIKKSNNLILLAAVGFVETGRYLDAELYVQNACLRIDEYSTEYQEIVQLLKLKADAYFGRKSLNEIHYELDNLIRNTNNTSIKLSLKAWHLRNSILLMFENKSFDYNIFDEFSLYFEQVSAADFEDDVKYVLFLTNCDSILGIYLELLAKIQLKTSIQKRLGVIGQDASLFSEYRFVASIFESLMKLVEDAIKVAEETENEILKASANLRLVKYFWATILNTTISNESKKLSLEPAVEAEFKGLLYRAVNATKTFETAGHAGEAYQALGVAYELTVLFEHIYGGSLPISSSSIKTNISTFEREIGVQKKFQSITEKKIEQIKQISEIDSTQHIKKLNNDSIDELAENLLFSLNLPPDRLPNIIKNIHNQRDFSLANKNSNLILLEQKSHMESQETMFAKPIKYKLYDKKSGLTSIEYSDVSELILAYQYLLEQNESN